MGINKPYYRIIRPSKDIEYIFDDRYSKNMTELIRSYNILESDLKKIFEYIEPKGKNFETYSHRTYELLLRICTEFELNCKYILKANKYIKKNGKSKKVEEKYWNITDYWKVNKACKLSEYKIRVNLSNFEGTIIKPFEDWNNEEYSKLKWYDEYNQVKHNRYENFHLASLKNALKALAGLFVILYAQFDRFIFDSYQPVCYTLSDYDGYTTLGSSLFSIKGPNWDEKDKYDFNWGDIPESKREFNTYPF